MKLLWRDAWIDVPGYEVPPAGCLISVVAAIPLTKLGNASGRLMRRPLRKVATFLVTDGPRSTLRKVRAKRDGRHLTGDLGTSVVMGFRIPSLEHVVALAPRVPPGSQQVVVHHHLVRNVADGYSLRDLERLAYSLSEELGVLVRECRQSFLYSGMEPSPALLALLDHCLQPDAITSLDAPPRSGPVVRPPRGRDAPADTLLRLRSSRPGGIPVAVLGAGDYARTEVIPALERAGFSLHALSDREPQLAAVVAEHHHFAVVTTESQRAIAELPSPGLVVVGTAHDSHTHLACAALEAGHRVFVQKPPTITAEDVHRLAAAMRSRPGSVEIGFNRRYHPLVRRAKTRLLRESGPTSISCVVKELALEPDHWYFWPNQASRIAGNLCHWIDLACFLLEGSPLPVSLTLSPRPPGFPPGSDEERVLTVTFEDGSLLTILGTTRGDDVRGVQESIDIRRGRTTITIDDLWKLKVRSEGIERYSRSLFRDKGHGAMYREVLQRFRDGEAASYPVSDMVVVSAVQIAASDLIRSDANTGELPEWLSLVGGGAHWKGRRPAPDITATVV
jgi:predicted dehydrogenase